MTPISASDAKRVKRPARSSSPHTHWVEAARIAFALGIGMPRLAKYDVDPVEVLQLSLAVDEELPAPVEADDEQERASEKSADGREEVVES